MHPPYASTIRITNPGNGSAYTTRRSALDMVRDSIAAPIVDTDGTVRRITLSIARAEIHKSEENQLATKQQMRRIPFVGDVDRLLSRRVK